MINPLIYVDTRERKPLVFNYCRTRKTKLEVGDYSIYGKKNYAVVEYKSAADFIVWLSPGDHKRYKRQVSKLMRIEKKIVVVGGSIDSYFPRVKSSVEHVIEKLTELHSNNIHVIFCRNRRISAMMTKTFLISV